MGDVEKPDLSQFQSISTGFRGEYRISEAVPPSLYFSPLDGRLHLKGAQAGLFNLGDDLALRTVNLDEDEYLDAWLLEEVITATETASGDRQLLQAWFDLSGSMLYAGESSLRLVQTSLPTAEFEIQPPVDQASWQDFREKLALYDTRRQNPYDLSSWLRDVGEERFRLDGVRLLGYRALPGGLRLEIELLPNFRLQGEDLLGIPGLVAGRYLVTYTRGIFHLEQLTPTQLMLKITAQPDDTLPGVGLYHVTVSAVNLGKQDSSDLDVVVLAECQARPLELLRQATFVPGEGQVEWWLSWQPPQDQECQLTARLDSQDEVTMVEKRLVFSTTAPIGSTALQVLDQSTRNYQRLLAFGVLGALALLAGLVYWLCQRSWR